jgi:uncharacterized phosphosugar-binding protein
MIEEDGGALCESYLDSIGAILRRIQVEEADGLARAAQRLAEQVAADRLIHIYGPGGHSNLAAQEVFYRAGGLMHVAPILDGGTLLSNGALSSTDTERRPGYGRRVIADRRLGATDLLILVNTFGINAAVIDAALEARERGTFVIGVSARACSAAAPPDHPARHPSGLDLHQLVGIAIDTHVPAGDAIMSIRGFTEPVAAASTFANAFVLNALVIRTVALLAGQGIEPPVWRSRNVAGGDEANARHVERFRARVPGL